MNCGKFDKIFFNDLKNNTWSFEIYETALIKLCVSRYKWINLPITVNETYLEKSLNLLGRACFFKDEYIGMLALPFNYGGTWDVYWNPSSWIAFGGMGVQYHLDNQNSVAVYNNQFKLSELPVIKFYAKKLYKLDQIIDINLNAQKTPLLINCDQNLKQTLLQVYQKYEGNEPVIFGNKKRLNPDDLTILKTDAPYNADKLYAMKMNVWNEALQQLGIVNTVNQKKERMTVGENVMSVGGSMYSRNSGLIERKNACVAINAMFKPEKEIDVEFNDDEVLRNMAMSVSSQMGLGGNNE